MWIATRFRPGSTCLLAVWLALACTASDAHLILTPQSCATVPNGSAPPPLATVCGISVEISADEITSQGGTFSAGAFFTLYDVGPLAGGAAAITLTGALAFRWGIFSELVDTPAIGTNPFDDPAIANLRFVCGNCGDFSGQDLGTAVIPFAGAFDTRALTYDGEAFDRTSRAPIGTLGTLRLGAVPEPATLALLGLVLVLLIGTRGRAQHRSIVPSSPPGAAAVKPASLQAGRVLPSRHLRRR